MMSSVGSATREQASRSWGKTAEWFDGSGCVGRSHSERLRRFLLRITCRGLGARAGPGCSCGTGCSCWHGVLVLHGVLVRRSGVAFLTGRRGDLTAETQHSEEEETNPVWALAQLRRLGLGLVTVSHRNSAWSRVPHTSAHARILFGPYRAAGERLVSDPPPPFPTTTALVTPSLLSEIELLGQLDVPEVLASVAVVSDQPGQSRAHFPGGQSWKGEDRCEAVGLDPWRHRCNEVIGFVDQFEYPSHRECPANELRLSISFARQAGHASERLGFGTDEVGDDRGNGVRTPRRYPVEGMDFKPVDFVAQLSMDLMEKCDDDAGHTFAVRRRRNGHDQSLPLSPFLFWFLFWWTTAGAGSTRSSRRRSWRRRCGIEPTPSGTDSSGRRRPGAAPDRTPGARRRSRARAVHFVAAGVCHVHGRQLDPGDRREALGSEVLGDRQRRDRVHTRRPSGVGVCT